MKDVLILKKDGLVTKIPVTPGTRLEKDNEHKANVDNLHLCTKCDNCYAHKCQKVMDINKRSLSKYDFITDGVQYYDENGVQVLFYVTRCNQFVPDHERRRASTKEEMDKRVRDKESMAIHRFEAENIDEAESIQLSLFQRGLLVPYKPYTKKK